MCFDAARRTFGMPKLLCNENVYIYICSATDADAIAVMSLMLEINASFMPFTEIALLLRN